MFFLSGEEKRGEDKRQTRIFNRTFYAKCYKNVRSGIEYSHLDSYRRVRYNYALSRNAYQMRRFTSSCRQCSYKRRYFGDPTGRLDGKNRESSFSSSNIPTEFLYCSCKFALLYKEHIMRGRGREDCNEGKDDCTINILIDNLRIIHSLCEC